MLLGGVIFLILSILLFTVMLMPMHNFQFQLFMDFTKVKNVKNFKELYIKMLSLGGSVSPKELVAMFGFDIEDENFWEIGIKEIQKLINEFMELQSCQKQS